MFSDYSDMPDITGHKVIASGPEGVLIELNKNLIDRQISDAVRLSQKNNVPMNFDKLIELFERAYGKADTDTVHIKQLLQYLRDSNPYKRG